MNLVGRTWRQPCRSTQAGPSRAPTHPHIGSVHGGPVCPPSGAGSNKQFKIKARDQIVVEAPDLKNNSFKGCDRCLNDTLENEMKRQGAFPAESLLKKSLTRSSMTDLCSAIARRLPDRRLFGKFEPLGARVWPAPDLQTALQTVCHHTARERHAHMSKPKSGPSKTYQTKASFFFLHKVTRSLT